MRKDRFGADLEQASRYLEEAQHYRGVGQGSPRVTLRPAPRLRLEVVRAGPNPRPTAVGTPLTLALCDFRDLREDHPIDELIGLVIGAVLAFLGTTYAAVLVKRYEARETARERILTELLPPLWRTVLSETRSEEQLSDLRDALNELRWIADVAGPTESQFAERLNDAASAWRRKLEAGGQGSDDEGVDYEREFDNDDDDGDEGQYDRATLKLSTAFDTACSEFNEYLVKRHRRAWWEPF